MIIGITGGIGSGKSTITQELARRGFAVYDCDREAKQMIEQNASLRTQIIALLGTDAFCEERYNTAYVAKRVFAEPLLLAQLNTIVHPAVKEDIQAKGKTLKANEVLFVESAILFEAGLDSLCDHVVIVDAPEEIRFARVIARDYRGEATEEHLNKVRARMCAQKYPPCTNALIIVNDGRTPVHELAEKMLAELFFTK
jgi:dephospho-CoA kinase